MDKLEKFREDLQNIDHKLVQLFLQRIEVATRIGKYKRKCHMPVFQAEQEEKVLKRVKHLAQNEKEEELLEKLFHCIMDLSKEVQE